MSITREELAAQLTAFRNSTGVPGAGAAIVTEHHTVIAAVGSRVRGGAEEVSSADRWHIGSCGKALTAALYARLVQQGIAMWETTLEEVFDDLSPRPHPAWAEVTMTDLLTHVAGLPANLTRAEMRDSFLSSELPADQRMEVTTRYLSQAPMGKGNFRYSNLGYTIAGAVIERLTGEPFTDALRGEVLEPLGMQTAGIGAPTGNQPWGHRPRWLLYGRGPAVDPANMSLPHPADNPAVITPAGRYHVSLQDWASFVRHFMNNSTGFLTPESVAMLTTPPQGSKSEQGMGWALPRNDSVALLQHGCNLRWVATCLIAADRRTAALVVSNDGRKSLLPANTKLALSLLSDSGSRVDGAGQRK